MVAALHSLNKNVIAMCLTMSYMRNIAYLDIFPFRLLGGRCFSSPSRGFRSGFNSAPPPDSILAHPTSQAGDHPVILKLSALTKQQQCFFRLSLLDQADFLRTQLQAKIVI